MIILEMIFNIANLFFLLASYPLIKQTYSSKDELQGISLSGAILTSMGMLLMLSAQIFMVNILSIIMILPTVGFWIYVVYRKVL
jgi:hypothetical protein